MDEKINLNKPNKMSRGEFRHAGLFLLDGLEWNYPVKKYKVRICSRLIVRDKYCHASWNNDKRILCIEHDSRLAWLDLFHILLHEFIHMILDEESDYYDKNNDLIDSLPIREIEKDILFDELTHDDRFWKKYVKIQKNLKNKPR